MRWALLAALTAVAIFYFAVPGRAQEACESWTVEMWEEEGGSILTAAACAKQFPDAWLSLTCFEGTLGIRYDLAYGAERSPDLDEQRDVTFTLGDKTETVPMDHQAMDGLFAATVPADGALVGLLEGDGELAIKDTDSFYPFRTYSLAGALEAIAEIRASC